MARTETEVAATSGPVSEYPTPGAIPDLKIQTEALTIQAVRLRPGDAKGAQLSDLLHLASLDIHPHSEPHP